MMRKQLHTCTVVVGRGCYLLYLHNESLTRPWHQKNNKAKKVQDEESFLPCTKIPTKEKD